MGKLLTAVQKSFIGLLVVMLAGFYPSSYAFAEGTSPNDIQPNTTTSQPTEVSQEGTSPETSTNNTTQPQPEPTTPVLRSEELVSPQADLVPTDVPLSNETVVSQPQVTSSTAIVEPVAESEDGNKKIKKEKRRDIKDSKVLTINNTLDSHSTSGNAAVLQNEKAGNATSGDASVVANIFNLLQSSTNLLGADGMVTFSSDIDGDVFGDLFIDPAALGQLQTDQTSSTDLHVTSSQSSTINNNILLGALSGSATVKGNDEAGSATTGSADAVANVVNIINSAIYAGQSFFGVINIHGNLNGDILLPEGMLNSLLASNSQLPTSQIENPEILADFTNNNSINNNISQTALSGSATVKGNDEAGSATTGSAKTNLRILNLTGHDVIASNSLLVFVNVLGEWVGLIMNAPNGSTAAAIGGGVSQANVTVASQNSDIDMNNTNQINNNIALNATTGNAAVANNDKAGNATSGNASTSLNLLNISNSQFSLSNWFGVLFINVFGSWRGSFGINTAAGNLPANPSNGGGRGGDVETGIMPAVASSNRPKAFRFIPTDNNSYRLAATSLNVEESNVAPSQNVASVNDTQVKDDFSQDVRPTLANATTNNSSMNFKIMAYGGLATLLLFAISRLVLARRGV